MELGSNSLRVGGMTWPSFRTSPAGRLVTGVHEGKPYAAFVPNPLPPEVAFTPELVAVLSAADRALGELAGLGRTLPNPHLLIQPFIRREAVLSSRIEGTQTGVTDLYAFEAQQPRAAGRRGDDADAREVLNYVRAMEYGLTRIQTLPV